MARMTIKYKDFAGDFNRILNKIAYNEQDKTIEVSFDDLYEGQTINLIKSLEGVEVYRQICRDEANVELTTEEATKELDGIVSTINKAYHWDLKIGKKYIVK